MIDVGVPCKRRSKIIEIISQGSFCHDWLAAVAVRSDMKSLVVSVVVSQTVCGLGTLITGCHLIPLGLSPSNINEVGMTLALLRSAGCPLTLKCLMVLFTPSLVFPLLTSSLISLGFWPTGISTPGQRANFFLQNVSRGY